MYYIKIYRLEVTGIHNKYSIEKEAWDATAYSDLGRRCVEGVNELVRITVVCVLLAVKVIRLHHHWHVYILLLYSHIV